MPRKLVSLLLLAAVLGGCVTTADGDKSLERMQYNHRAAVETAA
jgi:hypothetical protein